MEKIVLSDCDGCLCNFQTAFDNWILENYSMVSIDKTSYRLGDRYKFTNAEVKDALAYWTRAGGFKHLKKKPHAERVSILNPIILTARPAESKVDTAMWLLQNSIRFKTIIFSDNKSDYADPSKVVAYFEDHPRHASDFAAKGIQVYVFDYPYNRDVIGATVHRINGWNEVPVEKILQELRHEP